MNNRVKVGVRVRPMGKAELENEGTNIISIDNAKVVNVKNNAFEYDWAFGINSTQKEIYDAICLPLIKNLFEGFNAVSYFLKIYFLKIYFLQNYFLMQFAIVDCSCLWSNWFW